jgi:hypothetical protein
MEDDLNIFENGRRPQLVFNVNGRRPYFYLLNGRSKNIIEKIMQPEILKLKQWLWHRSG